MTDCAIQAQSAGWKHIPSAQCRGGSPGSSEEEREQTEHSADHGNAARDHHLGRELREEVTARVAGAEEVLGEAAVALVVLHGPNIPQAPVDCTGGQNPTNTSALSSSLATFSMRLSSFFVHSLFAGRHPS